MIIGIAWFTSNGELLADKIKNCIKAEFNSYNSKTENLGNWVKSQFEKSDAIIFIGAVGIAVRLIAKHIVSKDTDPAVIVLDEKASFVIPILSGHIRGANRLSLELSQKLSSTPVITTATDINNKFAVDVWSSENNCVIADISEIKYISSAVLENRVVGFKSDFKVCGDLPSELTYCESGEVGVYVSLDDSQKPFEHTANVIPKQIVIGAGCRKNIESSAFEQAVLSKLSKLKISIKAVKAIASIDIKSNEKCIVDFSEKYTIPFVTYSSDELKSVEGEFSSSEFVQSVTGVSNVCETSAVLLSNGRLIEGKTLHNGITLAVAMSDWRCLF